MNDVAEDWEAKYGDEAKKQFKADLDQCLVFLSDGKAAAKSRKASLNWNSIETDILTYLDNVSTDQWRSAFIPLIEGTMVDTAKQLVISFGAQFDIQNIPALQWFDEYTLTFAQEISKTTKDGMAALLQQGRAEGWSIEVMQDRMELMFKQWRDGTTDKQEWDWYDARMPNYRRETIARTESMRAVNYGSLHIIQEAGVEKKEWLATGDKRTRPSHMDAWAQYSGAKGAIPVMQAFQVGGQSMQYAGDPAGGSEGINCRCTVIPYFDKAAFDNKPPK